MKKLFLLALASSMVYIPYSVTIWWHWGMTPFTRHAVVKHCEKVAKKLELEGKVTFDFRFKNHRYEPSGYFISSEDLVWLHPSIQRTLFRRTRFSPLRPFLDTCKPTYADFVLLHELGHVYSIKKSGRAQRRGVWLRHGLGGFALLTLGSLDAGILSSAAATLPILGSMLIVDSYLEERAADRFATKKMCELYGYEKTHTFLEQQSKYDPGCGGGIDGYQSYKKLLRYSQRLRMYDQLKDSFKKRDLTSTTGLMMNIIKKFIK